MPRRTQPDSASRLRKFWSLKPGTIFLNHGSFGACPKPILSLQSKLRAEMEAEPVQFLWRHYDKRLDASRVALSKFIGAHPRDLVFVTNTTSAINAVVRSINLRRGDELLTTNLDYNASHNVLIEAAARAGAKVVVARIPFPLSHERQILEAIQRAATKRTRLALIDHVTSDTAMVLPVAAITRELKRRGIDVLVDGAHAPGMVPLNVSRLGAAYYAGNLHKWVCAPKGAAFLWAHKEKQGTIQPAAISHGNNRARKGHSKFQDRFDWPGTFDPTAWLCVPEAIQWMKGLLPGGWAELRRRNLLLAIEARRLLCEAFAVKPACGESLLGSMATVELPQRFQGKLPEGKIDREQLRLYDRFRIEVPFSRVNGRRYLRVSAQVYNSMKDYERLAEAMSIM